MKSCGAPPPRATAPELWGQAAPTASPRFLHPWARGTHAHSSSCSSLASTSGQRFSSTDLIDTLPMEITLPPATTDDHKQETLVILCNGASLTFASSGSKSAGTSKKEQQLLVQHSVKREQHMPSSWPSLKPWPKIENCLQIFFHRWQHMLPYFYWIPFKAAAGSGTAASIFSSRFVLICGRCFGLELLHWCMPVRFYYIFYLFHRRKVLIDNSFINLGFLVLHKCTASLICYTILSQSLSFGIWHVET